MTDFMKDGTLYFSLTLFKADEQPGDLCLPVYFSKKELVKNHPHAPYFRMSQKNETLSFESFEGIPQVAEDEIE